MRRREKAVASRFSGRAGRVFHSPISGLAVACTAERKSRMTKRKTSKKAFLPTIITLLIILHLCSCANMTGETPHSDNSAADPGFSGNTNLVDNTTSASEITGVAHNPLNIEYGRFYSVYDEDYKQIREAIDDYVMNRALRDRNSRFSEDVATGVIPETIHVDYYGTDFELSLSSNKYANYTSFVCPILMYSNKTLGMRYEIDAETLGEKYYHLTSYTPALSMHTDTSVEKTKDELLNLAKDFAAPRLEKCHHNENDYHIITKEPTDGKPAGIYYFYFISDNRYLNDTEIAMVAIDAFGFLQEAYIYGVRCLDSAFEARLPDIDEKVLIEQANNRFRESGCDCNLSISYRVFQREYEGEMYAELQCAIIPDNKNPETHHHDYINNQFSVFLDLTD